MEEQKLSRKYESLKLRNKRKGGTTKQISKNKQL